MYLAIDIGATKTLLVVFNQKGKVMKKLRFPTSTSDKSFLSDLSSTLQTIKRFRFPISRIVCAVPGAEQKNYTFLLGNRDWLNFTPLPIIKSVFSCPVNCYNDANLGALYETSFYSGRIVYLTFSTGIGGGIAENGHLLERLSNQFEPGSQMYIYGDQKLKWDDIASARAVSTIYQTLSTKIRAKKPLQDIAYRISLGLTDIIRTYRPDIIIFGGHLGSILPRYRRPLIRELRAHLTSSATPVEIPKLVVARHPDNSTIHGCLKKLKELDGDA